MISLFVLVFSSVTLAKFAVSQWRAIWITAASQPLSDALELAAGIDEASLSSQDFGALIALCEKLSPGLQKSSWLKEISIYYRLVSILEQLGRFNIPSFSAWARREMQICSRYAAVVLDQSLSVKLHRQLATQYR